MSTKLENMLAYLDGLLPIKSHDPFIIWSCEMKWQTKTITSSLQQCLWPPILTGSWLILSKSYPQSYSNLWPRGFARFHGRLKPLYLHCYSPYGHQTWLGDDLPSRTPIIWPIILYDYYHVLSYLLLSYHMTPIIWVIRPSIRWSC